MRCLPMRGRGKSCLRPVGVGGERGGRFRSDPLGSLSTRMPCYDLAVGTSGSSGGGVPCERGCRWTGPLSTRMPCFDLAVGTSGSSGGWSALWTRASLDAPRALLRAVSMSVGGNRAGDKGTGAWRSLDSSSVGTKERTSERRVSLCRSSRLVSTIVVWLATNSKVFAKETMSLWKFE